jgi:hypothetical protein
LVVLAAGHRRDPGGRGLLVVDIDTVEATRLLAMRCKAYEPTDEATKLALG